VGFHRLDLERRQAISVVEEDAVYGGIFQIDASADTLVYTSQDALHPPDLWVADRSVAKRRRLTHNNPSLDRYAFGTSRIIEWQTRKGATLRGALLLPPNFREGVRVPLVVHVYGGSTLSNNVNLFGLVGQPVDNLQLLATRGYAVLTPDTSLDVGTPMRDIADTVLPGVAHLVSAGIADPERLGVMGHSYGGYSTLALIVQTTEFRAAIVSAGKADLIASYGQMSGDGSAPEVGRAEAGQGRMGGSPWQYQSRYLENSPIHYLDRVETPVLLVHGELDTTVPVWLADQVFVGLRRLGKPVTYARYAGEDHWPGTWSHANVVDYWNRVLAWFDQYLGAKKQ
jgi:dipeptidyl aminopeptidase/acylaminoacyl peptidase